jgi:hypothetical protein
MNRRQKRFYQPSGLDALMLAANAAGMAMACPDMTPEASTGKPGRGLFRWRPASRPSPLAITLAAILVIL